eukprot:252736_1
MGNARGNVNKKGLGDKTKKEKPKRRSSKSKSKSKPKIKKCNCLVYMQTNTHCCKQQCLTETSDYTQLTKIWLFTEEHVLQLKQSFKIIFSDLHLEDLVSIIGQYLRGIHSTLEEYTIFCHGPIDMNTHCLQNNPCPIWLKTRNKQIQMEILGIKNVGKSSIALKCSENIYLNDNNINNEEIQSVYIKKVIYDKNIILKLRISDHSLSDTINGIGNGSMVSMINNGRNGYDFIYILCVDPSSDNHFESFQSIKDYHYKLSLQDNQSFTSDNMRHDSVSCAFIVVATKCDLKNQSYIRRSEIIIIYCKENNIPYIELSAKQNINMDKFLKICLYELWIQTQSSRL